MIPTLFSSATILSTSLLERRQLGKRERREGGREGGGGRGRERREGGREGEGEERDGGVTGIAATNQ